MENTNITEDSLERLKSIRTMLNRICNEVEEFCVEEEYTTLDCVLELKAELYEARAQILRHKIGKIK
jgi:hypothetical protein